jgi:hypothetical protein
LLLISKSASAKFLAVDLEISSDIVWLLSSKTLFLLSIFESVVMQFSLSISNSVFAVDV